MANLLYTTDLKADVLFRIGEPTDGSSDFDSKVLEYLNRALNTLALGGGEFNEDIQEDWWWLRQDPPGVLILQAPYETGTVAVTNNSDAITFSDPPTFTGAEWCLQIDGLNTVFRVTAHTASEASATLDSVYTGVTDAAASFTLFRVTYPVASNVFRIIAPMRGYAECPFEVDGTEVKAMDRDYPLARIEKGVPTHFAHVTETKVRFNRYGVDTNGGLLRVEYDYLFKPPDMAGTENEEPAVPRSYRRILADMAVFWLYLDKDDNRDVKLAELVKRGIRAMEFEHRHRVTSYSRHYGKLMPRGRRKTSIGVLRTESGHIIG